MESAIPIQEAQMPIVWIFPQVLEQSHDHPARNHRIDGIDLTKSTRQSIFTDGVRMLRAPSISRIL
jgi:hypothetical protein